jgi:hypothetical protein
MNQVNDDSKRIESLLRIQVIPFTWLYMMWTLLLTLQLYIELFIVVQIVMCSRVFVKSSSKNFLLSATCMLSGLSHYSCHGVYLFKYTQLHESRDDR